MKRLLVDAGHVLWGRQDGGRQEQDCKKRESEALGHGGTSFRPIAKPNLNLPVLARDIVFLALRYNAKMLFRSFREVPEGTFSQECRIKIHLNFLG